MTHRAIEREELAAFLRSRRERLQPAQVGIDPHFSTRRTPGLRRAEVAQRAGVSLTWYTWLEQARRIRVSTQVLSSLARALLLDAAETAHLFNLAGELPPDESRIGAAVGVAQASPYVDLLSRLLPLPAAVVDKQWNLVAANGSFEILLGLDSGPDELTRNLVEVLFQPWVKDLFLDWEEEAANTVASFRASVGRTISDPRVTARVDRLRATRPEFDEMWGRQDVVSDSASVHRFRHPALGRFDLVSVQLFAAATDAAMIVYQPAAADSAVLDRFSTLLASRSTMPPDLENAAAGASARGNLASVVQLDFSRSTGDSRRRDRDAAAAGG